MLRRRMKPDEEDRPWHIEERADPWGDGTALRMSLLTVAIGGSSPAVRSMTLASHALSVACLRRKIPPSPWASPKPEQAPHELLVATLRVAECAHWPHQGCFTATSLVGLLSYMCSACTKGPMATAGLGVWPSVGHRLRPDRTTTRAAYVGAIAAVSYVAYRAKFLRALDVVTAADWELPPAHIRRHPGGVPSDGRITVLRRPVVAATNKA